MGIMAQAYKKNGDHYLTTVTGEWDATVTELVSGKQLDYPAGSLTAEIAVRKNTDGLWTAWDVATMSADAPFTAGNKRVTRDMMVGQVYGLLTQRARQDARNAMLASVAVVAPVETVSVPVESDADTCCTCGKGMDDIACFCLHTCEDDVPVAETGRAALVEALPVDVLVSVLVSEGAVTPAAPKITAADVKAERDAKIAELTGKAARINKARELRKAQNVAGVRPDNRAAQSFAPAAPAESEAERAAKRNDVHEKLSAIARVVVADVAASEEKVPAALRALASEAPEGDRDRAARVAGAVAAAKARSEAREAQSGDVVPCETLVKSVVMRGRGKKRAPVEISEIKKITSRLGIMPVGEEIDGKGVCPECRALVGLHSSGAVSGHKRGGVSAPSVGLSQRQVPSVGSKGEDARGADVARAAENAAHAAGTPGELVDVAKLSGEAAKLAAKLNERVGSDGGLVSVELRAEAVKLADRLDMDDFETDTAREGARAKLAKLWTAIRGAQAVESGAVVVGAKFDTDAAKRKGANALATGPALVPQIGRAQGGYTWAPDAKAVTIGPERMAGGFDGTKTLGEVGNMTKSQARRYYRQVAAARKARTGERVAERAAAPVMVTPGRVKGKKQHGERAELSVAGSALTGAEIRSMRKSVPARREGSALTHYGVTVRDAESAELSREGAGIAESGVASL
jgi:hypothetical protein